jgi:hypothetical protein
MRLTSTNFLTLSPGSIKSSKFPPLPSLRVLTLDTATTRWPAAVSFIAASLPAAIPRLEVLNIHVYYDAALTDLFCSEVDVALAGLPRLRIVHFIVQAGHINTEPDQHVELGAYRATVQKFLPLAHRAGRLAFFKGSPARRVEFPDPDAW